MIVDELLSDRDELRARARTSLGITGEDHAPAPLREAIRASGVGWYPLVALGVLVIVDELQTVVFSILGPEIAGTLGITKTQLGTLIGLKTLCITLAALPMAAYVQRKARRGALAIATAFAWSMLTGLTAFVSNVWGLLLILVADGSSSGSVTAIHRPLLMDSYPPEARVRAFSFYGAANSLGNVLAPAAVFIATFAFGLSWRGVFLVMGACSIAAAFAAVRLRDPGFGAFDTKKVRDVVRSANHDDLPAPEEAALGFFEIARRLMMIPTMRRILAAFAVLGMLLIPLQTFLSFFLADTWGMSASERAVFFTIMPLFGIASLVVFGRRGEAMFRDDPARVLRVSGWLLMLTVVALAFGALMPAYGLVILFFGIGFGGIAAIAPALAISMLSIIPARMRPHAQALQGIFLAGVGAFGGLLLLGGIDRRFGTGGALVSLLIPGVVGGLIMRSAGSTINDDLDRMIDAIVEEEEIGHARRRGQTLPMLACRHIDFAYDQVQVLFDVDFTVDDGEMVALLGTNGAGKSTLLRVISGLGLPSAGSVRFHGADITYVDAERRVGYGITQIPGGRAVFGPMTVAENLRVLGHLHGHDRRAADAGIDACFDAFPRLAERRNQLASTLSGGEQQMLALATAFILRPRLLAIDELSLGLAPKVVGELLEMVRRINAAGTAIVLVEQSVNIALSLVQHAYFMEKGEMRFDGDAAELLARPDLLRSVFLEGAGKRLNGTRDA